MRCRWNILRGGGKTGAGITSSAQPSSLVTTGFTGFTLCSLLWTKMEKVVDNPNRREICVASCGSE